LSNLSPNNAAIELRKSWNLGVGPINDLSLLLKRNNIFAFNFDFFTSHIDGVSTKNKYLPPVICANYQSTDRLRFTFAHELGHIVLHQNTFPTEDIEEEANQFAAELLLPEISVKDELRNLKFSRLPALKQRWKVSMSSIIYRAKELNLISTETASSYFMRLNQLGYRKKEPYNESIKESEGTLFKDVVDHISLSKSISVKEISQKAGLSLREFNQLL
jgi:Zn-dependent peptidase ImmA (M78 family)